MGICTLIGLPAALVFSAIFLFPNASVQNLTLGLSAAASTIAIVSVGLVSAVFYSLKLKMTTVKDLKP